MDEYVWVSLCVREWVAKEGILSPASLKQCRSVQKIFLCLYWREDHTKSYAVAVAIIQACAMKCDVTLVEPWISRFMTILNYNHKVVFLIKILKLF